MRLACRLSGSRNGRGATDSPTVNQLRRLAERCKRPLSVFYLPEPPAEISKRYGTSAGCLVRATAASVRSSPMRFARPTTAPGGARGIERPREAPPSRHHRPDNRTIPRPLRRACGNGWA